MNVSSVAYNPWNDIRKRQDVAALNLKFPWEKVPSKIAIKNLIYFHIICEVYIYVSLISRKFC